MILRTVIGLIALLVSSAAQSQAYYTYQSWSALSEPARAIYLSGAFDSLVTFASGEQEKRITAHYFKCIYTAKMSGSQLAANVLNFAKDKPELHTGSVQAALFKYLFATCGEPPTK
jgi:hypothetical protein